MMNSVKKTPSQGWAVLALSKQSIVDKQSQSTLPAPLTDCRKEQDLEALQGICGLQIGAIEIVHEQRSSEWIHQRQLRITASNCKAVKTAKSNDTKTNILNRHLYKARVDTTETRYGIEMEPLALKCYQIHLHTLDASLKVQESGLWINAQCPELACSPDGIVVNSAGARIGLVEIKCPAMLRDTPIENFYTVLTKQQQSGFCLEKRGG